MHESKTHVAHCTISGTVCERKVPYILAYKSLPRISRPPKMRVPVWPKIVDPRISRRWFLRACRPTGDWETISTSGTHSVVGPGATPRVCFPLPFLCPPHPPIACPSVDARPWTTATSVLVHWMQAWLIISSTEAYYSCLLYTSPSPRD